LLLLGCPLRWLLTLRWQLDPLCAIPSPRLRIRLPGSTLKRLIAKQLKRERGARLDASWRTG
jgi:hypothetical protein